MVKILKKKTIPLVLSFFCLLLAFGAQTYNLPLINPLLTRLDGFIYDSMTKLNKHQIVQNPRVVIIDIDDESVQHEGRWPWPRDKFVNLLTQLKNAGVVVVAFDIVMAEAELNYAQGLKEKINTLPLENLPGATQLIPLLNNIAPYMDNDKAFARALQNNDVVLGYLFHENPDVKKGFLPQPLRNEKNEFINTSQLTVYSFAGFNSILPLFLKAAPHSGFVSGIPDADGIVRRGLLLASYHDKLYASLTLTTVMRYLLADNIKLITHDAGNKRALDGIEVGGLFIPTNEQGQILIPFWGLPGTIDYYSASDIIKGTFAAKDLEGAIAIVGSSMVLLSDLHPSPVSQSFPGVEMNANMMIAMLTQQITHSFNWSSAQGITLFSTIGLITALLFPFLGPVSLIIVYLLIIVLLLLIVFILFVKQKLYVSLTITFFMITLQTISNFLYSFILERRQKNNIKELFGQYVPPSYVKEITEFPERYNLEGETREMTVFFTDIRNFTTLSESLSANDVKRLLNTIFTPVTEIIFANQGTIDKYVGDMVMAFWGAPLNDPEHARHAIKAAIDIQNHLPVINEQLEQMNLPCVSIGIGLSTGEMNVGDMGSAFRRVYTVLGDTVNLASRLQDLTKFYRTGILVSETTCFNQSDYIWQRIDKIAVKGRKKSVVIYKPVGYYQNASPALFDELQAYEQALKSYYEQDWPSAKGAFETLHMAYPANYLYEFYSKRIDDFMRKPPPPDWDGSYIFRKK